MEAEPTLNPNCPGCVAAGKRIAELEARVATLERIIDELRRGGKRQAAPFSKSPPKVDPKKPGRKPGDDYGVKARRATPPRVDEVHGAPLPRACPACGGKHVEHTHTAHQYQAEIPRRVIYRRFDVRVGRCRDCGKRVQGRHELQTGDALGAAASQLGPDAQALAVHLNKEAGLSHGKVKRFFEGVFGIGLSRGGSAHAVLRAGRRCEGDYAAIVERVRSAGHVAADETGWRVGGRTAWLHAAATKDAVAYLIHGNRSFEASAQLLGEDFAGRMTHDGWAPYKRFWRAIHQLCLAHLLRRCNDLLETATRGAVTFPRKVKAILKEALAVRDDRDAGRIGAARAKRRAGDLDKRMEALLRRRKTHPPNERFAAHLWANRKHLFTFLGHDGIDATNWRAEQAIRPAVVNRKVWGGNRTQAGARAQSVLMSVLGTTALLGRDSMQFFSRLLCAPRDQRPSLIAG